MHGPLIMKFGGSVLRGAGDYVRAARLVKAMLGAARGVVVVVSAMKGVTDLLLKAAGGCEESAGEVVSRHRRAVSDLLAAGARPGGPASDAERMLRELEKLLWAARLLGDPTPRAVDYILSFGEKLSASLMACALEAAGVEARWMTGRDAGIVTDASFGCAKPIEEVSSGLVRESLGPLLDAGVVPVVTGFVAGTQDGVVTTLGRGGSDYTATLLAKYLGASEVRLYTDTPGVMTADPRLVPDARVVSAMSLEEASEMARLSAKGFHPRTFEPLRGTGIRIRVTSPNGNPGTLIAEHTRGPPVKSLVVVGGFALAPTGSGGEVGVVRPLPGFEPLLIARGRAEGDLTALVLVGEGVGEPEVFGAVVRTVAPFGPRLVYKGHGPSLVLLVDHGPVRELAEKVHREVVLAWWSGSGSPF